MKIFLFYVKMRRTWRQRTTGQATRPMNKPEENPQDPTDDLDGDDDLDLLNRDLLNSKEQRQRKIDEYVKKHSDLEDMVIRDTDLYYKLIDRHNRKMRDLMKAHTAYKQNFDKRLKEMKENHEEALRQMKRDLPPNDPQCKALLMKSEIRKAQLMEDLQEAEERIDKARDEELQYCANTLKARGNCGYSDEELLELGLMQFIYDDYEEAKRRMYEKQKADKPVLDFSKGVPSVEELWAAARAGGYRGSQRKRRSRRKSRSRKSKKRKSRSLVRQYRSRKKVLG